MHCLDASFQVAYEFDARPGLKFLVQKVFKATVAANLYKQSITAYAIRSLTMFEMARRAPLVGRQVYALFNADAKVSVDVYRFHKFSRST